MYREASHSMSVCLDLSNWFIQANIPELYIAVDTTTNEFPVSTPLKVDVHNPALMFTPKFYHCVSRIEPRVVNPDSTVTEACRENISGHLVRSKRSYTAPRPSRNILSI